MKIKMKKNKMKKKKKNKDSEVLAKKVLENLRSLKQGGY